MAAVRERGRRKAMFCVGAWYLRPTRGRVPERRPGTRVPPFGSDWAPSLLPRRAAAGISEGGD